MSARPDARRHRVVVTAYAFEPGYRAGGPIRSVAEVLDRIDPDVSCLLVTSDRDLGDDAPYPGLSGALVDRDRHQVLYVDRRDPRHWLRALRLVRRARPDVLYLNSFWSPLFTVLPVLAVLTRLVRPRRVLLAPRGEFSPEALALKSTKKDAVLPLWSRLLRATRPLLQASSPAEAERVRAVLPWAASSVVLQTSTGAAPARQVEPAGDRPRLVFVGRISPMKNVRLLLEAVCATRTPLTLHLYGPVEDPAYWAECTAVLDRLPATAVVEHLGELRPPEVRRTFAAYDGFVFPTLGENFGHVVAESLGSGCPVMCSTATPWTDLLREGGGAVLDTYEPAAWAQQIDAWASRSAQDRTRAKATALQAYTRWREATTGSLAVQTVLDTLDGTPAAGTPATGSPDHLDTPSPRSDALTDGRKQAQR